MKKISLTFLSDPKQIAFPLVRCPIHYYEDKTKVPIWLTCLESKIREADGYVIVSGEYNESIPPALTNMMDHFPPRAYAFKPCAIVTYSASKGLFTLSDSESKREIFFSYSTPLE